MKINYVVTIFCMICCVVPPFASSDSAVPYCHLQGTPLENCENYDRYIIKDKELNSAYKTLTKSLDKNNLLLLKKKQRQWIEWRDNQCLEAQERSGCTNSSCDSNAHDGCIMHLTDQRALELRQFIKIPGEAAKQKFDFSRKNKYLDDE